MYQQQQPYNPYAGLFGIIGTIMGMNAAKRNEAGIASALGNIGQQPAQQPAPVEVLQTPSNAPVPIQSQNVQQSMGLLPSAGFGTNVDPNAPMAVPDVAPRVVSPQDKMTQPQGLDAPQVMAEQPAPVAPTPVEPAPVAPTPAQAPIKTDIQKTYQQQGKQAIMELISKRGMSYREAQKAVDDIVKQRSEEDFNTAANQYSDQLNSKLDDVIGLDFSTNANKSKALGVISQINRGMQKIGRPGVDMGLMKELMGVNDLKIDKVDTGDGIQYVGYNSDGSKVVPIGSKIMKQVSPDTVYNGQSRIAAAAARGAGGGSGNREDTAAIRYHQHVIDSFASKYKNAKPTVDAEGNFITPNPQNDPEYQTYLQSRDYLQGRFSPAQPQVQKPQTQERI